MLKRGQLGLEWRVAKALPRKESPLGTGGKVSPNTAQMEWRCEEDEESKTEEDLVSKYECMCKKCMSTGWFWSSAKQGAAGFTFTLNSYAMEGSARKRIVGQTIQDVPSAALSSGETHGFHEADEGTALWVIAEEKQSVTVKVLKKQNRTDNHLKIQKLDY